MSDMTYEIPTAIMIVAMEPVVDETGVTNMAQVVISTLEGPTRRFAMATDDLRHLVNMVEETLDGEKL